MLKEIPEEALALPIEFLDLSNNEFEEFPPELEMIPSLQKLNLSHNQLKSMPNQSLKDLPSLQWLDISYNSFEDLKDLHPDTFLLGGKKLTYLSLAGNLMEILTDVDETHLLRSKSLQTLDMSNCKISKSIGSYVLSGLPSLKKLILTGNSFSSLMSFPASNIHTLILKNCSLTKLGSHFFDNIRNLDILDISYNPDFAFSTNADEILDSKQLKVLDISFCNLVDFDARGFPNLIKLVLKGNLIRKITAEHLAQNSALRILDMSNNGVRDIDLRAFEELTVLEEMDLSYNNIQYLEHNLFQYNSALISLNLERNYLRLLEKLNIKSLETLNLRWCEIEGITPDSLNSMPKLENLILSNNLVSFLPKYWMSNSLKLLNISKNRLTMISDYTLGNFPALEVLDVSGNRLSNSFTLLSFEKNNRLYKLWLGDNTWRCDCANDDFKQFYYHFGGNHDTAKIQDPNNVKCLSPTQHSGETWESACSLYWNPRAYKDSGQKVMGGILSFIIILTGILFAVSCVKKAIHNRKIRRDQDELRANVREMRNIQRMNNDFLVSQQDISHPEALIRESNPPCYEDALRMPKLERNFKSMEEISNVRKQRNSALSSKTSDNANLIDHPDNQSPPMKSKKRFRSEQVLNRDLERTIAIHPFPRSKRIVNNSGSRIYAYEDGHFTSSQMKLENLHFAEQGNDFKDCEYSPYAKRKNKDLGRQSSFQLAVADVNRNSIEFLTDSELSIQNSPFARRKPFLLTNSTQGKISTSSLRPVEDHFGSTNVRSVSSNEFIKLSADASESDLSMVEDVGEICALIHEPPEVTLKSSPSQGLKTACTDL